jgi:hypothetical protein
LPSEIFTNDVSFAYSSRKLAAIAQLGAGISVSVDTTIVDQYTAPTTASYSPGVGLTNNVYRQHLFNIGATDVIGPNSYSRYGFYDEQQSLSPPIIAPTKSLGIDFIHRHDIRPLLNRCASNSYANSVNSATVVNPTESSSRLAFPLTTLILQHDWSGLTMFWAERWQARSSILSPTRPTAVALALGALEMRWSINCSSY